MTEYEITIVVRGEDDMKPASVLAAVNHMIAFAQRNPPDRRIDWRTARVDAAARSPSRGEG